MLLGRVLARGGRVLVRLLGMILRVLGMLLCLVVLTHLVMRGRLAMMLGRLLVVRSRVTVMLRCRVWRLLCHCGLPSDCAGPRDRPIADMSQDGDHAKREGRRFALPGTDYLRYRRGRVSA